MKHSIKKSKYLYGKFTTLNHHFIDRLDFKMLIVRVKSFKAIIKSAFVILYNYHRCRYICSSPSTFVCPFEPGCRAFFTRVYYAGNILQKSHGFFTGNISPDNLQLLTHSRLPFQSIGSRWNFYLMGKLLAHFQHQTSQTINPRDISETL